MKKFATITAMLLLTVGFLLAAQERAEAMHNKPAVTLAGTIAIDTPATNVVVRGILYPGQEYARAYPVHYRHAYPSTRYVERTKIIYADPKHSRLHRHRDWAYGRGHNDEWCRHEHHRERDNDRKDHRHRHHDNRWD